MVEQQPPSIMSDSSGFRLSSLLLDVSKTKHRQHSLIPYSSNSIISLRGATIFGATTVKLGLAARLLLLSAGPGGGVGGVVEGEGDGDGDPLPISASGDVM